MHFKIAWTALARIFTSITKATQASANLAALHGKSLCVEGAKDFELALISQATVAETCFPNVGGLT